MAAVLLGPGSAADTHADSVGGCAAAARALAPLPAARSSFTTEHIIGKTVDEALKLKNSDIANHLSLPPVKKHCRCVGGVPMFVRSVRVLPHACALCRACV